jgi:hypothetical protein
MSASALMIPGCVCCDFDRFDCGGCRLPKQYTVTIGGLPEIHLGCPLGDIGFSIDVPSPNGVYTVQGPAWGTDCYYKYQTPVAIYGGVIPVWLCVHLQWYNWWFGGVGLWRVHLSWISGSNVSCDQGWPLIPCTPSLVCSWEAPAWSTECEGADEVTYQGDNGTCVVTA